MIFIVKAHCHNCGRLLDIRANDSIIGGTGDLYVETGDQDAFENMLRHVTIGPAFGDWWKVLGDDPDIAWQAWNVDITTEVP